MSDKQLINCLFDFTDLRKKSQNQPLTIKGSVELLSSQNEAILKTFKELRDNARLQSREISNLKEELQIQTLRGRQNQQVLDGTLRDNFQLKQKIATLINQNQDYKKRLNLMKSALESQKNIQNQLQFTKQAFLEEKIHRGEIQCEKNQLIQISINEKMSLEEQINRLKFKIQKDNQYIQEIEDNHNKSREKILKLENEIKKITMNLEEEVFNKKWSNENYQTQHLLETIKDLQKDITVLKAKNKKQKQKKIELQDRIIELEQLSGFNNVKAQTFESQIDMITTKYQKMQRKMKELKAKLEKSNEEKLQFEQNLSKVIVIYQEFSGKLKGINHFQVNNLIKEYDGKLMFVNEDREKIIEKIATFSNTEKISSFQATNKLKQQQTYSQYQSQSKYQTNQSTPLKQIKKNIQIKQHSQTKTPIQQSNLTFGQRQNDYENITIENRIRKEREHMQKKLKEKMMHRRIQSTTNQQLYRLRGDYITNFVQKRY